MKAKEFVMVALLVTGFFWFVGWQQPTPAGESQDSAPTNPTSADSTAKTKTSTKEKHWSGNLVDVSCMAKALAQGANAAGPAAAPAPSTPHFVGASEPTPQAGQGPGGAGTNPNPGMGNAPSTQGQYPTTDTTNPQDQARAAQEARIDNAAKQCAATPTTQTFGLAMSDGQVVQFDPNGNTKASEALKQTPVEPGKKVKAKVAGTLENSTTVEVASVDIKSKGKRPTTE